MSFRNDRRRRVLADDQLNSDESPSRGDEPLPVKSGLRYAPAAMRENQLRLIDLVPLRPLTLTLFFGVGLTLIAGLLAAFAWMPELSAYIPQEALAPLDLAAEHNLATWFASLLLLSSMQVALVVYSLRRHRVDDYHGRYRVWLWMAVASLATSVELATGVKHLLKVALAPAARWCGMAEHYGLWFFLGAVALYLTVRLVLETRRSPGTLISLILSAIAFAAPSVVPTLVYIEPTVQMSLLSSGALLLGCLLMLTGSMLFVRHVMLDVEGKLPERKPRKKKAAKPKQVKAKKAIEAAEETGKKLIVDPPQKPRPHILGRTTDLDAPPKPALAPKPTFVPSRPTAAVAPVKSKVDDDDDDDDIEETGSSSDPRSLSRADRKRLKREAKLARRS